MNAQNPKQIVYTLTARCRDCYRCLRVCPVKAIRMHNGQAYVDEQRCISCGTCIRECPQQAKTYRRDIESAQCLLNSKARTAVSVAPSFATVFNGWQIRRLPSALRKLGFFFVGQTSQGAYQLACATLAVMNGAEKGSRKIATACPAVVNYVEKYRPDLVPNLTELVSPMMAHAKMLKERFGADIGVIFVGPCVAKKTELENKSLSGIVDAVLTFEELAEWFAKSNIDLSKCEESDFDEDPAGKAGLFPLSGGMLKTAGLQADFQNLDVLAVSGVESFKESLDLAASGKGSCLIEPLFCPEGCINGPGINTAKNVFARRQDIVIYTGAAGKSVPRKIYDKGMFAVRYEDKSGFNRVDISEEDISAVLERTGKADPKQQLNCGACGYGSCREKAIAVIQGMADPEICIPHMRRLAELRGDRILEKSPNGIVILDEKLNIISANASFQKFFVCTNAILGRNISYLIDPSPFERMSEGKADTLELTVSYPSYNLICHGLFYALREEKQYVGIFVDITNLKKNEKRLEDIKLQTITQARELLEHQIESAQGIAKFLGETTARGEELIDKLMSLDDTDEPQKE